MSKLLTLLFVAVLSGSVFVSTGTARAEMPDFMICDGLTGAAWGLCRAGVAAGCADDTGDIPSCMEIEETFMTVTGGDEAPWIAPPLPPCPCDYSVVPQTEAEWTTSLFDSEFDSILYTCTLGPSPDANFSSWDGVEFNVGAQMEAGTVTVDRCSVFPLDRSLGMIFNDLTPDETLACRQDIIDYAATFRALNPDVPVDDLCTSTL